MTEYFFYLIIFATFATETNYINTINMKNKLHLSIAMLLLLVPWIGATAQKAIGIDFFKEVKMISNVQVYQDNIYFIVKQADMEENRYRSDLYRLVDGQPIPLTASHDVGNYQLLSDGSLLFRGARQAKDKERIAKGEPLTIYQRLAPGMGEAQEWLRLPYNVGQLLFITDDHFFFTASYDDQFAGYLTQAQGDTAKALQEKARNKPYRIFEEIPFWSNGRGDVSGKRTHLFHYQKGKITALSDTYENVGGLTLSPDKKTLLYTSTQYQGKAPLGNHLMRLSVESLKAEELIPLKGTARYGGFAFLSNNEVVLTATQQFDRIGNASFYRLNLSNGSISAIYSGDPYGLGNSIGSDIKMGSANSGIKADAEGFYYTSTVIDHAPLLRADWKGNIQFVTKGKEMIMEYTPYKEGFLTVAMIGDAPNEIYFLDKQGGMKPLTQMNSQLLTDYSVVTPEEFSFKNENGLSIGGWIIKPVGYEEGKKYPTILDIHGGPKTAYGPFFFHEMQYWANQGYVVIFTNPTGGDGRCNQFADIRAKYGTVDYRDLMRFVDEAIKRYDCIDADRMGVTGGSYGGFMTNWIIGHTNRFKAAASQRSIASWISFSNTTDIGYTFIHSQIGGDVWTEHDKLWEQSPLKYADKAKTPTLFIHSDEDYRCWMSEGIQMFYALKYFGVPARLCLFHGENHELSRSGKPQNRVKRLDEITRWMDSYLKQ